MEPGLVFLVRPDESGESLTHQLISRRLFHSAALLNLAVQFVAQVAHGISLPAPSSPAVIWPCFNALGAAMFQEFSLKRDMQIGRPQSGSPAPPCFKPSLHGALATLFAEVRCDTARAG